MSDKEISDTHRRTDRRPHSRHSKHESNRNEWYDRNDRHRRHDRSDRRPKRRDDSNSDYNGSDRRDHQRKDNHSRRRPPSRSGSRSRSRSRERQSQNSSSRREENTSQTKTQSINESVIKDNKEVNKGIGIQHKNTLEIMRQQIKTKTGIEVPEYYNPGAVNPIKYAEQEKKRKLLWSREEDTKILEEKSVKPKPHSTSNLWNSLKFEGEKGNEMTEKFRKLMGIKDKAKSSSPPVSGQSNESAIESQKTLFRDLDMQYSIARLSAHTQRGVGLGFGGPQSHSSSTGASLSSDRK